MTLVALAALLSAACATVEIPEGACRRGGYYVPGEMVMQPRYAEAFFAVFGRQSSEQTFDQFIVDQRLDELERYCWARRVE